MNSIKILFMDVDGTLTDGKIYMGPCGEVFKAFDIKDGYAIHKILPKHEILPVIITGRTSKIVEMRALELGIIELYQGIADKVDCIKQVAEKYGCSIKETAFIGDDLNDLPAMQLCGEAGCPSDAVCVVKAECSYVCNAIGGHGAVREFIEWLIEAKG